jgi:Glycogen recognition site of AMP-activated protein kinase
MTFVRATAAATIAAIATILPPGACASARPDGHVPGGTVIRLAMADAPAGKVSVAGDFNDWQPVPMRREGHEWVLRLSLTTGVYHYAFRAASGEWFVPASTPGRHDDGMGGHNAVLVVG